MTPLDPQDSSNCCSRPDAARSGGEKSLCVNSAPRRKIVRKPDSLAPGCASLTSVSFKLGNEVSDGSVERAL